MLPILLVLAGLALLAVGRASGLLTVASEASDVSSVPQLEPPMLPVVGILDSAASDVMELLGVVDEKTKRLADSFAKAEGFGIPGAIPTRANNPGDLKLGDIGYGELNGHTVFATVEDGQNALYKLIGKMRSGKSKYYKPDMTFEQIARIYAGNWQPWVLNVTRELGISAQTTLRQYYEG